MDVSTIDLACFRTGQLILVYLHPESSVYCDLWKHKLKNIQPIRECKTNTEWKNKLNRNVVDEACKTPYSVLIALLVLILVLTFLSRSDQGICSLWVGCLYMRFRLMRTSSPHRSFTYSPAVLNCLSLDLLNLLLWTITDRYTHFYLNCFKPFLFNTSTMCPQTQGRSQLYTHSLIRELNISACAGQWLCTQRCWLCLCVSCAVK